MARKRDSGAAEQHKDGRFAGAPAGVAQRRDPARGSPPCGRKRFRGEAGKVAQQTAAADAQADAEADGRPLARRQGRCRIAGKIAQ